MRFLLVINNFSSMEMLHSIERNLICKIKAYEFYFVFGRRDEY